MLRDVGFFQSRLGKIDGFEDAGDYLLSVIKSKDFKVTTPAPAQAPAPVSEPASVPTPIPESEPSPVPAPTDSPAPVQAAPTFPDNDVEKKPVAEMSAELQAQFQQTPTK